MKQTERIKRAMRWLFNRLALASFLLCVALLSLNVILSLLSSDSETFEWSWQEKSCYRCLEIDGSLVSFSILSGRPESWISCFTVTTAGWLPHIHENSVLLLLDVRDESNTETDGSVTVRTTSKYFSIETWKLTVICGIAPVFWLLRRRRVRKNAPFASARSSAATADMTPAPKLNYGQRGEPRWQQYLLPIARTALIVGVAWYFVTQLPPLIRQLRCRHFSLPSGTVVYDDDPATSERLLSSSAYRIVCQYAGPLTPQPRRTRPVGHVAPTLYPQFNVGAVFIHPRRTFVGNNERLVFVAASTYQETTAGYDVLIDASAFLPRTPLPGSEDQEVSRCGCILAVPRGRRLRLFAGQADASDPTHFSFDYELGGLSGTIDGWVRDDGEKGIAFSVRSGPAVIR